jgi:hypothetical protein
VRGFSLTRLGMEADNLAELRICDRVLKTKAKLPQADRRKAEAGSHCCN